MQSDNHTKNVNWKIMSLNYEKIMSLNLVSLGGIYYEYENLRFLSENISVIAY